LPNRVSKKKKSTEEILLFTKAQKARRQSNRCHELANDRIPLDTGMTAFVKWFELEQGERFVLNRFVTGSLMEEFGDRNGTIPFTATKAKAWFLQQTDFNNESPRYKTNAFVYDPYNEKIRELMTTFWAHYSQENDVSWKDQPLYRYLLSKLRIQPASFPSIIAAHMAWTGKMDRT
jgi:hypothetical protein